MPTWAWGFIAWMAVGILLAELYRNGCRRTGADVSWFTYWFGAVVWPVPLGLALFGKKKETER